MYWQERYLEETKQFGGLTGIDTIDLPNAGLLGGIEFRVWGTCGAGLADPDVWLHDRLTRIELIVNGSQVVKSYSGDQLLAMMCYKKTNIYTHDTKNMSSGTCEEFFYINLGRFWHDLEYLLDLGKVNDPELRFTYNFSATSVQGWTNGTAMTAAPYRTVICHLLKDAPASPLGYIKTSELYRFTSGNAKKENMTVPRGPLFSNLYLQSWYYRQGFSIILDKVELNLNHSELIPFRLSPYELGTQNLRQYGLFEFSQQFTAKGGQGYPIPVESGVYVGVDTALFDAMHCGNDLWANYGNIALKQISSPTAPVTSNLNVWVTVKGIWPFSVAALPIFDPLDERTYLDSKKYGDIAVRVEETASGGTSLVLKLLGDEVVKTYL